MKAISVLAILALLACAVNAYISSFEYYAAGDMQARYVDPDTGSNNRGRYLFVYEARSKSLKFWVISTLTSVGSVTLNGPISCYNKQTGGTFGQSDPICAATTGPVVIRLGKGIAPTPGSEVGFQLFKGEITLTAVQEAMLFRNELNLHVNTLLTGTDGKQREVLAIRGQVYLYDHFSDTMYSYLAFENNRGQFDRETSKTANSGFGIISHNPSNNNKQLGLTIYSTIKQPGNYVLKCQSGTKTLEQDDNPVETTITFEDDEANLLLELFVEKSCYIFITSAEAPNGDLYSYFTNLGSMQAVGLGANQVPPVSSPYMSYSLATFDASHKTLDILTKHNITDTITAAHVHAADGTVLCDLARNGQLLPVRSFCRLNETSLDALENGELYLNIHTTTNPVSGELRGQITLKSKYSTGLLRNSAGASSSTAVGLGVGLGVGIPLLLLAIVGVLFLTKKGGNGKI